MLKVNRKKLSLAVMQALGAGAMVGVVVPAALAQTVPPATNADVQKFTTTVTGSRIPSANLESTSPITTITAQDIKLFAPLSAENLLNIMPQVIADQGQMVSNGVNGYVERQPARPGFGAHPGPYQRPPDAAGKSGEWRLWRRPERDTLAAGPAGGNPDRRRIRGLWFRCHCGRRELHHERPFPGRPIGRQPQLLQPPTAQLDR